MRQGWEFVNASDKRRQYYTPEREWTDKPILFFKQPFLVRSITIPYPRPELAKYLENAPPTGPVARTGLLSLPDEILLMILEDPDPTWAINSRVCLAITCKKLLVLAQPRLTHYRTFDLMAEWARCRIGCLGDRTDYEKVPDKLISPAMKDEIRATLEKNGPRYYHEPFQVFRFGFATAQLHRGATQQQAWALSLLKLPEADRRLFIAAIGAIYPPRNDWVLCNISKRQFVRADALAALNRKPDDQQPLLKHCLIDLGTALMMRIFWTSAHDDPNGVEAFIASKGSWVGDRHIITTIERAPYIEGDSRWEDVTDEVVADITTAFRMQYGDKWEDELRRFHFPPNDWLYCFDDDKQVEALFPDPERLMDRITRLEGEMSEMDIQIIPRRDYEGWDLL
ncbi:hypothetical protein C8Q73DRAFT_785355 [Cubamyces lactineus]|nr:hypothetical protein C8Q73DRAFT_785355 [Cubamyces lactineus]